MAPSNAQPLTPLTMAILLALTKEELHGYALMQEIAAETDGTVVPGTGSLYAALQRLEDEGFVEQAEHARASLTDPRRKYFRITAKGRAAAREEARRMIRVLEIAREKSLIPTRRSLREAR